jgi:hypothetical protein
MKNARFAEKFGIATILQEEKVNANELYLAILDLSENWYKIVKEVKEKMVFDKEASGKVVDILDKMLK